MWGFATTQCDVHLPGRDGSQDAIDAGECADFCLIEKNLSGFEN
jgi:hypothetical protein